MAAGSNINGLIDPSVGVTPGPNYALTINNNFDLIDSHDHSTGNGAQVNIANLAINNNFSMASNGILNLKFNQFIDASSLTINTSRSIYSKGNDLWFYNGAGLDIQITNASGLAGISGNISGLVAPASATFAGNTFTFNSTATTPGNLEAGDILFHNSANLTYKLTLKAPTLSSNIIQTLPTPPTSSTSFISMDTSGAMGATISTSNGITTSMIADINVTTAKIADLNVTTAKIADLNVTTAKIANGAVTASKKAALNISTSSSSSNGTWTGGWTDIPNLSVTITTNGRPVFISIMSDGSGNESTFGTTMNTDSAIRFVRGGSTISLFKLGNTSSGSYPYDMTYFPQLLYIETPAAGTYTYKAQMYAQSGAYIYYGYQKLVVFEL